MTATPAPRTAVGSSAARMDGVGKPRPNAMHKRGLEVKAALMAQQFEVQGRLVTVTPTGSGNVNDTFLAIFRTHFSEERFVLQRINTRVFPHPQYIMANMRRVTEHVHQRFEAEADRADRIWQLPRVIPARDGTDLAHDGDGGCWRAISLIDSAQAYDRVQGLEHAREAGTVLGMFQRVIKDLPHDQLHDTLVGFHITPHYLETYDRIIAAPEARDKLAASPHAAQCADFVHARRQWASILEDAKARGQLSLQPVHGDPKIANIMIDSATGKGTAIIDLDTVKPGLIHYDFGDCLRSCCNPGGEEETDLSRVYFDAGLCEAIVRGYMTYARDFLDDTERALLYDSIRLITFELGLRFFADFLAGDVYFKTRYEGQNLHRARVQFALVKSIEDQETAIRTIVENA